MIDECFNCRWANEFVLAYWYPHFDPTCVLGNPMNVKGECEDFKMIGRGSR